MDPTEEILKTTPCELLQILNLDLNRAFAEFDSGSILEHHYEINPYDFIKFSEEDIKSGDLRGLVNSLSNSKRAIDCQVNKTLTCFGISTNKNFPNKMDLLQKMGIISPRIIRKVTNARNYLEHDFKKPQQEQVEDAIDIATLFVHSLDNVLRYFPVTYSIDTEREDGLTNERGEVEREKWLYVEFEESDKIFVLTGFVCTVNGTESTPETRARERVAISRVKPTDPLFLDLIRLSLLVRYDTETRIDRTMEIRALLSNLR